MKKKSKFLTFIFSMMPGAGHMYLGFMKLGVSLMACFFAVIFFSMGINFSPIMLIIPIIWFYSFFDALNKNGLPDEEFYALEDRFIFNLDKMESEKFDLGKFRVLVAAGLIIIGSNMLLQNLLSVAYELLPSPFYTALHYMINMIPEVCIGIVIIFIGIKLIIGKNTELKQESILQITEKKEASQDENA